MESRRGRINCPKPHKISKQQPWTCQSQHPLLLCPRNHNGLQTGPERPRGHTPKRWQWVFRSQHYGWCSFFFSLFFKGICIFQIFNTCIPCVKSKTAMSLYLEKKATSINLKFKSMVHSSDVATRGSEVPASAWVSHPQAAGVRHPGQTLHRLWSWRTTSSVSPHATLPGTSLRPHSSAQLLSYEHS